VVSRPEAPSSVLLPDLHQAEVDRGTVEELFRDVALDAELLEVRVKGAARGHVGDETVDLAAARALLLSGDVRGVQLRYVHRGETWWDTVMALPGGAYRIVRIRPPIAPGV
jgi:hypothetical protein